MTIVMSDAVLANWPSSTTNAQDRVSESLYEVVGGRIVEKPAMGAYQTSVAINLLYLLLNHVRANKLGRALSEMLYLLDRAADLKRRPDVSFVSYTRWERTMPVPGTEAWDVVPDLAVEIVSPTNSAEGMLTKVGEYFRAGCDRVWIVYPIEKQVYVYRSPSQTHILTTHDELEGESAVAGFRVPVAALFDDAVAV
jgi:Uma2 family endonuclease